VVLNVREATIRRRDDGPLLAGLRLPDFVLAIVAQGGLLPKLVADGYIPTDPGAVSAGARSVDAVQLAP
jgi:hypothetical protein